jgi:peptide/nickel transport system permease protein
MTPEKLQNVIDSIIAEHGLDDPYPLQYARWLGRLLRGQWGWSPALQGEVLDALLRRAPVTAELALFSLLSLVPLGLIAGVLAGWREGTRFDDGFRLLAFSATSLPPFIVGLFLLSIFYVGLRWFPPGRTGIIELSLRSVTTFEHYTGLLVLDGLLNRRFDVVLDALRHLALPVLTLSLVHWATLARITRASIIDVRDQEYIAAARSRGLLPRSIVWRHAFRNVLVPSLTSSALSAASLITGVFVIEVIFNFKGLSELIILGVQGTPDAPLALGFAVFSVLLVLPIMFMLDLLRAWVDPRLHSEAVEQ